MSRKYTDYFKNKVVLAADKYSVKEVALLLKISPNTIYTWRYDAWNYSKYEDVTLEELRQIPDNEKYKQ